MTVIDQPNGSEPTAVLTTESSQSSYGQPVLRILSSSVFPHGDYGPADLLRYDDDGLGLHIRCTAAAYVAGRWAAGIMAGERIAEDDELCRKFCGAPVYHNDDARNPSVLIRPTPTYHPAVLC